MKKTMIFVLAYSVIAASVFAAVPDNFKLLVPRSHVMYNGTGPVGTSIGGYCYIASTGRFYTSTYGSGRGIRVFVGMNENFPVWPSPFVPENPLENADGRSWHCDTDSDLSRIMGATSFENGTTLMATHNLSGFTINPVSVFYNGITYAPGELAVLNQMYNTDSVDTTKRLLTWDFREIWSPTTKQPDHANSEHSPGYREVDIFGVEYGYGCTNWNDAFTSLMTFGEMAAAIGASVSVPTTSDQVGGRRSTFSADGAKIYFVSADLRSTGRLFTGVWSVELATKTVKRLLDDTAFTIAKPIAEPASVAIGVRNFTGDNYAANINQVLFNGTDASGNIGGINALVDDGSADPNIYPAVPAAAMLNFLGMDPNTPLASRPTYMSIAADEEANLYLYTSAPYSALYKYDTKGRLICVGTRLQHYAFNSDVTGTTTGTNTAYLRLDIRKVPSPYDPCQIIVQAMFMSTACKAVAGVNVYKPIDFNRDGSVTLADLNFFKTQIQKTWAGTVPVIADGNSYTDYIKADLNGNGVLNSTTPPTGMAEPCVTEKDREALWQFVVPGDVNLNHAIDLADFIALTENFCGTGKDWSQGDFDFDGTVDMDDFTLLSKHWLENYE